MPEPPTISAVITTETRPELDATGPIRPRLRGWSHFAAFIAAVTLCPLAIIFSPGQRLPVALYTGAVIGLFGISGAYHVFFWGTRGHGLFRRLDHAMIFLTIAASYTPVVLASLPRQGQIVLLTTVWVGALGGAISQLWWPRSPRWLNVALYVLIGWAILPAMNHIWTSLGAAAFSLIVIGGLLHTIGALVYATNRPDPSPRWFGFHEVFHLFVIAAIASHYIVIAMLISP